MVTSAILHSHQRRAIKTNSLSTSLSNTAGESSLTEVNEGQTITIDSQVLDDPLSSLTNKSGRAIRGRSSGSNVLAGSQVLNQGSTLAAGGRLDRDNNHITNAEFHVKTDSVSRVPLRPAEEGGLAVLDVDVDTGLPDLVLAGGTVNADPEGHGLVIRGGRSRGGGHAGEGEGGGHVGEGSAAAGFLDSTGPVLVDFVVVRRGGAALVVGADGGGHGGSDLAGDARLRGELRLWSGLGLVAVVTGLDAWLGGSLALTLALSRGIEALVTGAGEVLVGLKLVTDVTVGTGQGGSSQEGCQSQSRGELHIDGGETKEMYVKE